MKILDKFLIKDTTVLIVELFDDSIITNKIKIGDKQYKNFHVEKPKGCFSTPVTRNIIIFNETTVAGDYLDFI